MNNALFHIPSIQNLGAYKSAVKAIPDLSAEEELSLAQKLSEQDDLVSAQKLILSQLKTVVRVAQEYKNYGLDDADLIQEGNIGLMRAVKRFDYSQNVRLYTFSLVWIRSEIQAYVVKNWKMVKIATTKNLKKLFFNYRKLYKEFEHLGVSPQDIPAHIQRHLGVEAKEVEDMRSFFSGSDVSTEDFLIGEDSETFHKTPQSLIEYKTPEALMIKYRDSEKEQGLFEKAFANLNDREKTIITYRFLEVPQKTHKDISKILGISSERVRQVEAATISKLKNAVSPERQLENHGNDVTPASSQPTSLKKIEKTVNLKGVKSKKIHAEKERVEKLEKLEKLEISEKSNSHHEVSTSLADKDANVSLCVFDPSILPPSSSQPYQPQKTSLHKANCTDAEIKNIKSVKSVKSVN